MRVRLAIGLVAVVLCIVPVQAEHETPIPAVSSQEAAYEYLKGLPREWSGSSAIDCGTYEEKNIDASCTQLRWLRRRLSQGVRRHPRPSNDHIGTPHSAGTTVRLYWRERPLRW